MTWKSRSGKDRFSYEKNVIVLGAIRAFLGGVQEAEEEDIFHKNVVILHSMRRLLAILLLAAFSLPCIEEVNYGYPRMAHFEHVVIAHWSPLWHLETYVGACNVSCYDYSHMAGMPLDFTELLPYVLYGGLTSVTYGWAATASILLWTCETESVTHFSSLSLTLCLGTLLPCPLLGTCRTAVLPWLFLILGAVPVLAETIVRNIRQLRRRLVLR